MKKETFDDLREERDKWRQRFDDLLARFPVPGTPMTFKTSVVDRPLTIDTLSDALEAGEIRVPSQGETVTLRVGALRALIDDVPDHYGVLVEIDGRSREAIYAEHIGRRYHNEPLWIKIRSERPSERDTDNDHGAHVASTDR